MPLRLIDSPATGNTSRSRRSAASCSGRLDQLFSPPELRRWTAARPDRSSPMIPLTWNWGQRASPGSSQSFNHRINRQGILATKNSVVSQGNRQCVQGRNPVENDFHRDALEPLDRTF